MPTRPYHPPSHVMTAVVTLATLTAALTIVLLTAGTMSHHIGLLTWSMVTGMIALDLLVLVCVKRMMDDAVRRCTEVVKMDTKAIVEETAVRVGQAIAESLAEGEPMPPAPRAAGGGVRTLY